MAVWFMDWIVASPASLISKEVVLERLADPSFFSAAIFNRFYRDPKLAAEGGPWDRRNGRLWQSAEDTAADL